MAVDGPSPDQSHTAGAVRTSDAGEGARQAVRCSVADKFLTPQMPGSVLADGVHPTPSPTFEHIPAIPAWQFHQDAQSGVPPTVASPAVANSQAVKSTPPAGVKKSPFQPGRSAKYPQPRSATSTTKFDSATGILQKGTLQDYLALQLDRNGGAFITDKTWDGGSATEVRAMSKDLAKLIVQAPGVKVLYTDLVSAPNLLNRLVGRDGRPNETDLNTLLDEVMKRGVADSKDVTKEKLRAYVGILRAAHANGIAVKPLTGDAIKALGADLTKVEDDRTRSTPSTYIILASETKQYDNDRLFGLPTFTPAPNIGTAFKVQVTSGRNEVVFDPALAFTRAKTVKPAIPHKTATSHR